MIKLVVVSCVFALAFCIAALAAPVEFTADENVAVLNGLDLLSKQVGLNPTQRGTLASAVSAFDKVQAAAKPEPKKEEPAK
jgi:predicted DNA-binding transcriptional regulator YafY